MGYFRKGEGRRQRVGGTAWRGVLFRVTGMVSSDAEGELGDCLFGTAVVNQSAASQ